MSNDAMNQLCDDIISELPEIAPITGAIEEPASVEVTSKTRAPLGVCAVIFELAMAYPGRKLS